ncbi:YbaL family putative K(+) efflux transporter [Salinarimonas soli]|uniref:Kef family K(+) transporter n=1 Tax=Salinarimonas soli TaxID=1638099 RepID=A0A5B2V768_9HYPH|nr:YbaL family putative K(+) efflux transporter [Salinarimonas soli]KAA2234360.1 Kef family K(+) transporter [Salinarimonas soli]
MPHHTSLIATIVAGLCLAFVFGALAQRVRLSPLVGYLLAGVMIGPFTPGYVADQQLAPQLAEIGVILLMFGVGLHFSLADLMSVRAIAIPGAVAQIAVATALGMGLAHLLGWSLGAGLVFGLALSVASTVVLLRALQERRLVETEKGKIAVGWLIVEDLAMVLALVLLPATAGLLGGRTDAAAADPGGLVAWLAPGSVWAVLGWTLLKVAAFVGLMLVIGRRVIPWVLHWVAHTGSRELFRLAVLAIALGVAFGSAALFGVSFALGAFFAGMILAESELSHQAAKETLPLRDAFAVLFFVSVGMLVDPSIVVREPLSVLATIGIIVVGKSLAAFLIVRAFGHLAGTALTISASLAQIGEFSFILAGLGLSLGLLPREGNDLILAGAILSIMVNPLIFVALDRHAAREREARAGLESAAPASPAPELPATALTGHVVLVGHGRVGSLIAADLRAHGIPFLVVEENEARVARLREDGIEAIRGEAGMPGVLEAANLAGARRLVSAIPNPFEASTLIEAGRSVNPRLVVVARAHSDAEVEHLQRYGADHIVLGEREIAREMTARLLNRATTDDAGEDSPAPDGDAFEAARRRTA